VTPFFSVVIPVYNRAHQIESAVRSVLAQSEKDFEIVIVDDASADNPRPVLDAIGDPRLVYIRRETRGGGGTARNTGIDAARGKFIAFLDSDDVFLPHHLATMRRLLEGTEDTIGYARMIVDRGDGRAILKPPRAMMPGEHMATYLLCRRGFVPTITTVAPAECAKKIRYHADLPAAQDTDFALRAFIGGCRFVMAEAPGAIWNDVYDPGRLSAGRKGAELKGWIEGLKSQIPVPAYYGCLGWAYAKYVARTSKLRALALYLNALLRGAYPPRLACVIFLQIFLPDPVYRAIADGAITWLRVGMRPDADIAPRAAQLKRV
jgi:glycosyltransferase involved in cell wall biosynthesis